MALSKSPRLAPPKISPAGGRALAVPAGSVLLAFAVGAVIVAVTAASLEGLRGARLRRLGLFCFGGEPSVLQLSNHPWSFSTALIRRESPLPSPFRAGNVQYPAPRGSLIIGRDCRHGPLGIHLACLAGVCVVALVLFSGAWAAPPGAASWGPSSRPLTGAHEVVTTHHAQFRSRSVVSCGSCITLAPAAAAEVAARSHRQSGAFGAASHG